MQVQENSSQTNLELEPGISSRVKQYKFIGLQPTKISLRVVMSYIEVKGSVNPEMSQILQIYNPQRNFSKPISTYFCLQAVKICSETIISNLSITVILRKKEGLNSGVSFLFRGGEKLRVFLRVF
jgi:hypothetical protein